MTTPSKDLIHTAIWREEPEPDNPFATRSARCHGYDVYGAMLGKASWIEMVYLLLRAEAPDGGAAALLETLAVALANPGPRDPSVHAAMCGGVAGSTAAATLSAALAVAAGGYGGAREVLLAMRRWQQCGTNLTKWQADLTSPPDTSASIWPVQEHAAGFDPHAIRSPTIVIQTLEVLASQQGEGCLTWLRTHQGTLEVAARAPLSMTGVAACALHVLGFSPEQGEMLYLLLRLPGAAAHALEQQSGGFRQFPFFSIELEDAGAAS